MDNPVIQAYRNNSAKAQQQANKYEKLANQYSLQRLIVFGFLVVSIYVSVVQNDIWVFVFCLAVSVGWFAWLVTRQNKYDDLKRYCTSLKKVNENEIENILKRTNIYYNGSAFINERHYYNADLDIFGNGSLFQLINRAATPAGNHKLAEWLNAPADKSAILLRNDAVKELAQKNDWRLDFQTKLLFCFNQPANQVSNLMAYLKTAVEIKNEQWLSLYSKVSPFLLLILIALSIFYPTARYFLGAIILFNNRLVSSHAEIIKKTDLIAGKIGESLSLYALAFKCIEDEEWQSAYHKQLAMLLKNERDYAVSAKIKALSILINKLNNRLNMVVGFILNTIFIWDIRQVIAIENWKRNNHDHFETAFNVIAEFEAINSLSSLAVNYPDWCFPEIVEGEGYTYMAKNIAHPLIDPAWRVANNFELNDEFKIDIITGSNMAGKSTFLRTVGINAVLGLCGAPVCAEVMRLSVIRVITYMRIKDSLNESTSTFKAELDRLQMLLNAVEKEEKVYFLIDEMLRGTNSVDKYLGSKAVIRQLIGKNGVGQVATHDLQIARLEDEYPDYIRNFYFDIQVQNGEMLFDYRIKPGECKTFNASILLRQIGIDVKEE